MRSTASEDLSRVDLSRVEHCTDLYSTAQYHSIVHSLTAKFTVSQYSSQYQSMKRGAKHPCNPYNEVTQIYMMNDNIQYTVKSAVTQ